MTIVTKPNMQGLLLMVPKNPERACFIENQEFINEFIARAVSQYGDLNSKALKTLNRLRYNGKNIVIGSNNFIVVHAQPLLQEQGYSRVATLADLGATVNANDLNPEFGLDLKRSYEDPSILLQSERESNKDWKTLTKIIISDIKRRSKKGRIKFPVLIDHASLKLEVGDTPYGLVFRLGEDAIFSEDAEEFLPENHGKTYNITDERGYPIFEENGKRILCIHKHKGFSRLYLDSKLRLYSNLNDPDDSDSCGRIVGIRDETNYQNILKDLRTSLTIQYNMTLLERIEAEKSEIESRMCKLRQ